MRLWTVKLELTLPREAEYALSIGNVLLTKAGQELAAICGSNSVDGFYDFVHERWDETGLILGRVD